MKIAWIPPTSLLHYTNNTNYQLVLPQVLRADPSYAAHYTRSDLGFKILDNGAAEGALASVEELFRWAKAISADEIVVPDVLHDLHGTVNAARNFEMYTASYPDYGYMAVAQGQSITEVIQCIDRFGELDYITTIGIPRHLVDKGSQTRASLAEYTAKTLPDRSIHCLGMNVRDTMEVERLAKTGVVRGVDTSMPFFLGMWGFDLRRDNCAGAYRPTNYFQMATLGEDELEYIDRNVRHFEDMASASG